MSRFSALQRQRHSLVEMRDIMNSLKTLAYLETRKIGRYIEAQAAVVRNIETAAADLLTFHPEALPAQPPSASVCVLFGSERGFCGDFNHALLRQLDAFAAASNLLTPRLIAIGSKLHTLMEVEHRPALAIRGASVVDEVSDVLHPIVRALSELQDRHGTLEVNCIHHDRNGGISVRILLPPFEPLRRSGSRFSHPPLLNEPPPVVMAQLADHYLFAALHDMFYTSLMAESQQRIVHLDGAVQHLDEESAALARRGNALRQEEIINEIEVILLSAASVDERSGTPRHPA